MVGSPKKRARRQAEEAARKAREESGAQLPAIIQSRSIARLTPIGRHRAGPRQIPYTPDLTDAELDEALNQFTSQAQPGEPIDVDCEPVEDAERIQPKKETRGRKPGDGNIVLTPAQQEQMLDLLEQNQPIRKIREDLGITRWQLYKYIHNDPQFAEQYAKAKESSADYLASEIIALADSSLGLDAAGVQAVKLMIDSRKWTAAKLKPRIYGDQVNMRLEAHVAQISDDDLNAQITALLGVQHSQQAASAEVNEDEADE